MEPRRDIHNYERNYKRVKERIKESRISLKNQQLIFEFNRTCTLERLSISRKIRIISILIQLARDYLKKDFDKASKEDLKELILELDSKEELSVWTKHTYKSILKKFYKWLVYGDEYKDRPDYPEIISWMKANVSEKEKPKVKASDILTEEETEKLIQVAEHPRDKAFISMLYELGARIGEIGNLRIKDVSRDKHSFIVDLQGKTGHRTPRIVISDPYLSAWLNVHPLRDDPTAPLWVMIGDRNKNQRMVYGSFRALVLRIVKKSRIKKRVYPHLFRHTRATHLLANKQVNESQAKVYFGWMPSSNMLSEYSHLVSQDVNNVMLEINGIKTEESKEKEPKIKRCPRCKEINPKDHLFCNKCSSVLDVKTAVELDEKRSGFDNFISILIQEEGVQQALVKAMLKKGVGGQMMKLWNRA